MSVRAASIAALPALGLVHQSRRPALQVLPGLPFGYILSEDSTCTKYSLSIYNLFEACLYDSGFELRKYN
jgi:hypothetical protein